MSISPIKATPTPTGFGYAQIDSTQGSTESEIDAAGDPDNKKKVKSGLHGIAETASSIWTLVTTAFPFDMLPLAESIIREAHSSHEVERTTRPLITEALASSAREEERKASGKGLIARVAAIERPSRKKNLGASAPSYFEADRQKRLEEGAALRDRISAEVRATPAQDTPTIRIVPADQVSGTITALDINLQTSSMRVLRKGKGGVLVADVRDVLGDVRLVKDFSLCQEKLDGRCETVSLPKKLRQNIVSFLQDVDDHHREWNCSDFVKGAHGQPYKQHHFDFAEWDARPLSTSRAIPGDVVQIGSNTKIHFAIYLREDLYLSKLSDKGGFVISSLEEMTHFYQSDEVVLLRPKT